MNIESFYECLGEDYKKVFSRLGSEKLIESCLIKLYSDSSFNELSSAIDNYNIQDAFAASHTLKGLYFTLGLNRIGALFSDLTESLRQNEQREEVFILFKRAEAEYEVLQMLLEQFANS